LAVTVLLVRLEEMVAQDYQTPSRAHQHPALVVVAAGVVQEPLVRVVPVAVGLAQTAM